ncbi:MAG: MarR family transcriptional regulator [Ramlibacter sp.]|nr:MarR family transcriptional regulator [Cryobacterium sp.]
MAEDAHGDEIVWRLLDLHRRMHQEFERVAAEFELSAAEAGALRRLDKPYSMRAFADAIGCDASYVTILSDRLDALGLVQRIPDEYDRRVRQLVLTDKGEQMRRALTDRVLATSPALTNLDAQNRRAFVEFLRGRE